MPMPRCISCGADTELMVSGVATCPDCLDRPPRKPPLAEISAKLTAARKAWRDAMARHQQVQESASLLGPGHPDGTQALAQANRELEKAAAQYQAALQDFLERTKDQK